MACPCANHYLNVFDLTAAICTTHVEVPRSDAAGMRRRDRELSREKTVNPRRGGRDKKANTRTGCPSGRWTFERDAEDSCTTAKEATRPPTAVSPGRDPGAGRTGFSIAATAATYVFSEHVVIFHSLTNSQRSSASLFYGLLGFSDFCARPER